MGRTARISCRQLDTSDTAERGFAKSRHRIRSSFATFFLRLPGGVRYFSCKAIGASYGVGTPPTRLNSPAELSGKLLWGLGPSDVRFPPAAA
jgi:hypothetical protein